VARTCHAVVSELENPWFDERVAWEAREKQHSWLKRTGIMVGKCSHWCKHLK